MVWIIFHPKTFESVKRFGNESFLRSLWVVVQALQIMRPEMCLVPAVTSLNMHGFDFLVKIRWQLGGGFTKYCIQLKLKRVSLSIFLYNTLRIEKHYVDKNQSMTPTLTEPKSVLFENYTYQQCRPRSFQHATGTPATHRCWIQHTAHKPHLPPNPSDCPWAAIGQSMWCHAKVDFRARSSHWCHRSRQHSFVGFGKNLPRHLRVSEIPFWTEWTEW